ncbi:hypothetical protein GGS23DRAFT_558758 [Durotheca rogersii]|uniref:uncharacterized protein n=1 Tax=Durotheca rogersii TaxID=419775 RepID=UPI00222044F4|nr:uncharacterized protein GGS23DRAFT_558758 [Durotheca rogersii]KAI5865336.1 hypothetical protein GGS23DRAFT_558758 [Durotheca rogersii]
MASQQDGNTIYLTEQEAERIRNTVKERARKCSELEGQAREPRDPKGAISQATGAALMADMAAASITGPAPRRNQGDSVPALAIGQPYPPCIVPLADLEPMTLADLRMETHHRRRRLTVKKASPVVPHVARSWTMVQDIEGEEVERLELYLHKSRHGRDILTEASVMVIKEPYFTLSDDGEPTLRVDHPSDMIVYGDEEESSSSAPTDGPDGEAEDVAAVTDKARSYKDKGNAALADKNATLAHVYYTRGLELARQDKVFSSSPDLARDLSRNRAHVNLVLSQLDEAIADAKASLICGDDERSQELDSKAYFRAGCAAYNLGRFQEAKGLFEERLKLAPDNKETGALLRKIELRLREEQTGKYDFNKIRAGLSRARPRADVASFLRHTEVRDSPGRGRGLFATRDLAAGDVVLCEKAFCVAWGHEDEALTAMTYDVRDGQMRVSPVGLAEAIVQKLLGNPSQTGGVLALHGDYRGAGDVFATRDGPVVDTFRVHDIVSRNAFGPGSQYGERGARDASTGLWTRAAYMNHSCVPNARKEYVGDLMVVRALRPVAAGEELFHSYDESADYAARAAALANTWGFACDCALCAAERADGPALRDKRRDLAAEAEAFVAAEPWAGARRLTIVKAQRLARAIENTYDAERYAGVPRPAAQRIQDWLARATPRR